MVTLGMTAAASTAVCVHTRPYLGTSRSTRVQHAVVLLMYTKKYGRTYEHKATAVYTRVRHA